MFWCPVSNYNHYEKHDIKKSRRDSSILFMSKSDLILTRWHLPKQLKRKKLKEINVLI